MKLVIIEGIGKKETIEKYLGTGYRVFATKGHIRDLPQKSLAVDVKDNFKPRYEPIPDKKEIIKKMKAEASGADIVLLATDPDREGEAIAWHTAKILGLDEDKQIRIVFNEISKKAITAALESPREVDKSLVDAQQARRVLDRLVGYKVSPLLCKRLSGKLSAGRVQSVTLRLVVERDREIAAFKPEEYWNFSSVLSKDNNEFKAQLALKDGKKYKIHSADEVARVKAALDGKPYTVTEVKKSITLGRPPAPFITSSMQQDALNKLGMSLKQTSSAAQELYEGVELPGEGKTALITYIRTDSTRVSTDAQNEARAFIKSEYGAKFVPEKPNFYASKKGAQDAHEAIRPITVSRTPESVRKALSPALFKLYKLIYERFLASQMSPAEYDSLSVDIKNGIYGFKVTGKTMLFAGYTAVYKAFEDEKEDESGSNAKLPNFVENETLKFIKYFYEQKFTKPLPHYTEASLVKTMEEKGIGRPATYTPTVALLLSREYVTKEAKFLLATELGMQVTDMLIKYFPDIMDVKFTADMEEKLDEIEDGGKEWQRVVGDFYGGFAKELEAATGDKPPDEESEYSCPKCGNAMVYKNGRFGKFLACTGFPECRHTRQIDENGKPLEPVAVDSGEKCEVCGKPMVVKHSRYGAFLACTGYPECKYIKKDYAQSGNKDDEKQQNAKAKFVPEQRGKCPDCGKPLVKRKGRAGSEFFGCTGYPECKFASRYPVLDEKCPDCGTYMVEKQLKAGKFNECGKACGYKHKVD